MHRGLRVHVEEALRSVHRNVRVPHAGGEKEGLGVLAAQKFFGEVYGLLIAVLVFWSFKHAPVEFTGKILEAIVGMALGSGNAFVPGIPVCTSIPGIVELLKLEFVPLIGRVVAGNVVEDLPCPGHMVAVAAEVLGHGGDIGVAGAQVLVVVVDATGGGPEAAHNGRAGRVAEWSCTVGIGEQYATPGELVDVGRLDAGITAKAAHPVVEIVY